MKFLTDRGRRLSLLVAIACLLTLLGQQASAQQISIDLSSDASLTGRSIQLLLLVTVLSIAPGLAIMLTCFPFMVTVLAILRQALGLQQSPPNMLIVSLALFLTYFVMEPVFSQAWQSGIGPLLDEQIDAQTAFDRAMAPFRNFMITRIDAQMLGSFAEMRGADATAPMDEQALSLLVPTFMLSEISRAFQVGFLVFLPFLIIDLVVAAVLMSMGMMMVPPAIVSLPFKLAFFVVADGWALLTGALVSSYF